MAGQHHMEFTPQGFTQRHFSFEEVPKRKEWPKIRLERCGGSYTITRKKKVLQHFQHASFRESTSGTAFQCVLSQKYLWFYLKHSYHWPAMLCPKMSSLF
jgi:hypothetical protein